MVLIVHVITVTPTGENVKLLIDMENDLETFSLLQCLSQFFLIFIQPRIKTSQLCWDQDAVTCLLPRSLLVVPEQSF